MGKCDTVEVSGKFLVVYHIEDGRFLKTLQFAAANLALSRSRSPSVVQKLLFSHTPYCSLFKIISADYAMHSSFADLTIPGNGKPWKTLENTKKNILKKTSKNPRKHQ